MQNFAPLYGQKDRWTYAWRLDNWNSAALRTRLTPPNPPHSRRTQRPNWPAPWGRPRCTASHNCCCRGPARTAGRSRWAGCCCRDLPTEEEYERNNRSCPVEGLWKGKRSSPYVSARDIWYCRGRRRIPCRAIEHRRAPSSVSWWSFCGSRSEETVLNFLFFQVEKSGEKNQNFCRIKLNTRVDEWDWFFPANRADFRVNIPRLGHSKLNSTYMKV